VTAGGKRCAANEGACEIPSVGNRCSGGADFEFARACEEKPYAVPTTLRAATTRAAKLKSAIT
jgi:hypothetical protein